MNKKLNVYLSGSAVIVPGRLLSINQFLIIMMKNYIKYLQIQLIK